MCLNTSKVRKFRNWNWDGDIIDHDTVIPATRKTPTKRKKKYDIDIREFLGYDKSAVISKTLSKITEKLSPEDKILFASRQEGAFDFRAQVILRFISENIAYEHRDRMFDAWMFPEETLAEGGGDCEDRAFLLAALLLASGITGYCVRVVLGKLYSHAGHKSGQRSQDHVWVMYKNEAGIWQLIEPQVFYHRQTESDETTSLLKKRLFEYVPYYCFNDTHLWYISNRDPMRKMRDFCRKRESFFHKFDPSFAAGIHDNLFTAVLGAHGVTQSEIGWVTSLNDSIDTFGSFWHFYNPFQHFDNGYIQEGWKFVQDRASKDKPTLKDYVEAGHAIADFYAHSSYGQFAKEQNGVFELWQGSLDPTDTHLSTTPNYDKAPFDTLKKKLSVNPSLCANMTPRQIADTLNDKVLISGRFAQDSDIRHGFLGLPEAMVSYPSNLKHSSDYAWRGRLPHHNEIAVDSDLKKNKAPSDHKLYADAEYGRQFRLRTQTAQAHMDALYVQMGSPRLTA